MITSNTENGLQKATQLLNQPSTDKQVCKQPSESQKQGQEFTEIMGKMKLQQGGERVPREEITGNKMPVTSVLA